MTHIKFVLQSTPGTGLVTVLMPINNIELVLYDDGEHWLVFRGLQAERSKIISPSWAELEAMLIGNFH